METKVTISQSLSRKYTSN